MSRTILVMVSENHETIEQARKYWENHDVTFQVYSPSQWREGLDNVFFRQQLSAGMPALSSGNNPMNSNPVGSNVVPFPMGGNGVEPRVQKMEDLEARAIEDAIGQYKGNLTEAAKALGIGRATLYRKVKQYQIDPSAARKKKQAA
ncbi:MAG: hypothetical protein KF802_04190 [Bdellovibrionaceae bacterium]|nr:hypothetical protein [Pseudobdellovibrionaceae bacterium]